MHGVAEEGAEDEEEDEEEEAVEHVPREEFLALIQDMLARARQQQGELQRALQGG